MSLDAGILGYLSIKPLTGYDIKKLFNMTAAFFWPADQAQIYRSLKSLATSGLIERLDADEKGRRKEYAITDKGREVLRGWLLEVTMADFVQRCPATLQLFFSGTLSREEQLEFVDKQIQTNNKFVQSLRDNYEENGPVFATTVGLDHRNRYLEAATYARRWGILRGEAYGEFLQEIRAEI